MPIPKINCFVCGRKQGSNICWRCRKKIQKLIDSDLEPKGIVKIIIPFEQMILE